MTHALDLDGRVRDFVRQHPGLTLTEIARGVRARTVSVMDVLAGEAFSASPRGDYPSDRAQVYRLVPAPGERSGKAARRSQCDLIADVLFDGLPHSTSEIHRRCGFSRLNSRVAELRRRRGMLIVCEHVDGAVSGPDAQTYTFVGFKPGFGPWFETSSETDGGSAPASVSPDVPATQLDSLPQDHAATTEPVVGASTSQLQMDEAA